MKFNSLSLNGFFVWSMIKFQACILQTTGARISLKVTSVTIFCQGNVKLVFVPALISMIGNFRFLKSLIRDKHAFCHFWTLHDFSVTALSIIFIFFLRKWKRFKFDLSVNNCLIYLLNFVCHHLLNSFS